MPVFKKRGRNMLSAVETTSTPHKTRARAFMGRPLNHS